jgi:hypothetical protein
MVNAEKTEKAEPKGAGKRKRIGKPAGRSKPVKPAKPKAGQAQVVKKMLTKLESRMDKNQMKATMGDYIRLVQLHKDLDDESPKEIKVTWVEPAGDKAEKTGSGKEE